MKLSFSSVIILLLLATTLNASGKTVSGNLTMEFDLSAHDPGKEAQLWVPYPISNKYQAITNIRISGDFDASAVYTDRVFQTPMLYAHWGKNAKSHKLSFAFSASREEIIRGTLPEKEGPWNPSDFAIYLAATPLGPVDGEVKILADKIVAGKSTVLEKAKAVYDWTVENTYRDPNTLGCGVGDVYRLLRNPGGKCADISSIYVAIARAAGVPSREIFGIRMGKKPVEDITTWQHCWAQFYLPGYGWVSIDPADVRKMMLVENLKISDPKTVAYREYFWGSVDPYRIKLSEGRDLILNPPQAGQPVNYLMYPFAQVGSRTLDWLDPATFKYTIKYQQFGQ
jgi:transglutaminase-like putative cysteine protease